MIRFSSFPFFRQLDQMDCGAACLKMICAFYKKNYSIQQLREMSGITRQGVSVLGLCDAAEQIGMKTLALNISFESLVNDVPLPCIVHWRQRHFVVVYKTDDKHIWVADPAFGKVKYTHAKFLEGWLYNKKIKKEEEQEGFALFLEPSAEFYNKEGEVAGRPLDLRFLLPYLRTHKQILYQVMIGVLILSFIQVVFPFLTKALVDKGIRFNNLNFVYLILAGQLILFLSQTGAEIVRRWLLLYMSKRVNIAIVSDFLVKMMKLPIAFFDSKMITDLIQRIEDQKQIDTFLSNTSLSVLFSLINILLFGTVLCVFSFPLFLIFLAGSTLYFSWIMLFVKKRAVLSYKRRDESVENRSSILEIMHGIQEVKLNNSERRRRWEWESVQNRVYNTAVKELRLEQLQVVGGNFLLQLMNIIITFVAAWSVIEGRITLGVMLATQYIIGQLATPLNSFVAFIHGAAEARISIERIGEVLNVEEEDKQKNVFDVSDQDDDLVLDNVSFRYGSTSSRLVLKNISLTIPRGKVTAIVGTSGSGKTTLMKLLLKFYDPSSGSISLGDKSLEALDSRHWRSNCGVVMQDGFIFADTVLRNITESDNDYTIDKERLQQAVHVANIEDMIEQLPSGYHTNLSHGGIALSGGEYQRVLIARAVYKGPAFLFFDEATSSLDANNEKVIMENLQEFFKGRTVVIIAHRLSTVKHADKIIVLDKGEIIEEGDHTELVALKQHYFKLVKNQLELGK
ncbi:peptidase domain-containing ABC transporter [Chitinophaga pinensis]|uniref:Peptidase domain-containing ABC transporter n=1 Tax=Chitinophaga pinensis TaxID=79329 RepID=A0A5C6LU30_9BACT|nr:peptidase domain-containing ABC transporter [Chitinophaga pinensis]TWW00452.1 peptidase domain-containing ABC transporter [Chitinophaga pinensis]